MTAPTDSIYQFVITLQEVHPPVWRRIQVPASYSFWDLHVAIQDAMGWTDSHLHAFTLPEPRSGNTVNVGIPLEDDFDDEFQVLPGWNHRIVELFTLDSPRAQYEYDFGDSWMHDVVLEAVQPREPGATYPRCLDGARACPPENVGGTGGYEEFLEAIRDPQHEEHDRDLTWIGGSFDPEAFDPAQVLFDDPHERWEHAFAHEPEMALGPADFQGLSPNEVHELLYEPLNPDRSPMVLHWELPDEALTDAFFFADCRQYLSMLRERQPLRLTQSGNLPRRFVHELWTAGVLTEDMQWHPDAPPRNAGNARYLMVLNGVTRDSGLTRKQHGKLLLTRRAETMLDRKPASVLYRHVLEHYVRKYNWAYEDRMPSSWILQGGFGFFLFLLHQYGHEPRPAGFYADSFLRAFPAALRDFAESRWDTPEEAFARAFETRAVKRFAARFGLVRLIELEGEKRWPPTIPEVQAQAAPLLDQLLRWRVADLAGNGRGE